MDSKFIKEQKVKLEQRREELLRELNQDAVRHSDTGDFSARFPDYGDKEEDNAAEVDDFERNLSMEKNLEVSLFNVDKALRKIQEKKYGLCEKCGLPIDPERLAAFPSATSCMDCKRKGL
ncbi:MAG: TraR/DksA C4-type zinc finger protein [Candidatus Komeilibacteria bacterium]